MSVERVGGREVRSKSPKSDSSYISLCDMFMFVSMFTSHIATVIATTLQGSDQVLVGRVQHCMCVKMLIQGCYNFLTIL